MGRFRIEIFAVGGHGLDREQGDGCEIDLDVDGSAEKVALETVKQLEAAGFQVESASFHHWPGTDAQVVDNLLSGQRSGHFDH